MKSSTLLALVMVTVNAHASIINLGTAASFSVLGEAGVTNTRPSMIFGSVAGSTATANIVDPVSYRLERPDRHVGDHLTLLASGERPGIKRTCRAPLVIEQRLAVDRLIACVAAVCGSLLRRSSGKRNSPDLVLSRAVRPDVNPFAVARPGRDGLIPGFRGDLSRRAATRFHDIEIPVAVLIE